MKSCRSRCTVNTQSSKQGSFNVVKSCLLPSVTPYYKNSIKCFSVPFGCNSTWPCKSFFKKKKKIKPKIIRWKIKESIFSVNFRRGTMHVLENEKTCETTKCENWGGAKGDRFYARLSLERSWDKTVTLRRLRGVIIITWLEEYISSKFH
jgi:hypothetical protein